MRMPVILIPSTPPKRDVCSGQFECSRRMRPALSVQYTGSCCHPAHLCPQHKSVVCDNYGK